MKDIFAGLYNKIVGFFSNVEQKEADESKNIARNRLKLVLMQDRTNLNPNLLERMRGELIDLLSKYVEMDKEALDLNFENDGESVALMLSIPVIRAKEEEEIEATLKAEDEAKKELEEKLKALEESEKEEPDDEDDLEDEEDSEEDDEETSEEESDDEVEEIGSENEFSEEKKSEDKTTGSEEEPKKKKHKKKKKKKKAILNIPDVIEVSEVSEELVEIDVEGNSDEAENKEETQK